MYKVGDIVVCTSEHFARIPARGENAIHFEVEILACNAPLNEEDEVRYNAKPLKEPIGEYGVGSEFYIFSKDIVRLSTYSNLRDDIQDWLSE